MMRATALLALAACSGAPVVLEELPPADTGAPVADAAPDHRLGIRRDASPPPDVAADVSGPDVAAPDALADAPPLDAGSCFYVELVDAAVAEAWGCWHFVNADPVWVTCTGAAYPKHACQPSVLEAGPGATDWCCPRLDGGP